MKYLLILLMSTLVHAHEKPRFGGIGGTAKGVAIGDYSMFDQEDKRYGVCRYGVGYGRLQVGNTVGLVAGASGGGYLFKGDGVFSPVLGLEPFGGRVQLSTSGKQASYYQLIPMGVVGVRQKIGSYSLTPMAKGGTAVGNMAYFGIAPRMQVSHGYAVYLNNAHQGIGFERTVLKGANKATMTTFDVQHTHFMFKYEHIDGKTDEENYIFLVNLSGLL